MRHSRRDLLVLMMLPRGFRGDRRYLLHRDMVLLLDWVRLR